MRLIYTLLLDGVKGRSVYASTKPEVRVRLVEAVANRDKGLVFDAGNPSVGECLDEWLEAIRGSIGERTWKRHESIVRLHLKPAIGRSKLATLNPLQVQALYRAKSRSGDLAPGSVKRIHTTLRKALKQAVRWLDSSTSLERRWSRTPSGKTFLMPETCSPACGRINPSASRCQGLLLLSAV